MVPIPLASPACQDDGKHKFSHLRLSRLPRTTFTQSKLPAPPVRTGQIPIFASPLITATPWDIYIINWPAGDRARSSSSRRLCVLRLPHERQPRARRRPRAQQLLQKALCTAPATRKPAAGHAGQPATTRAAAPPEAPCTAGAVYCACHTKGSRGPAAPTRAAASPGGSVYCGCHTTAWCD